MSYQSAVMADSPAALWMLNETSGTIAHDSTGHGNDLTYVGTYTLGSPGVIHSDTSLPALGLTGVDTSGATLSTSSVISNNTVWTLEACIKTGSLPPANDWGSVIYCGNDQSPGGWGFGVGAPNDTPGGTNLVVLFGRVAWYDSGYSLSSDSDYHIVVTFNSPTLTFYVNGVQVSQLSASNPNNPAPNLYLGYETNTNINRGYNGTIQAVALYSTALTGTQVANHYSAYTPPGGILAKRRKSWGRIAPPVGTRINWSHPLANSLLFGFGLQDAGSERSFAAKPFVLDGATGVRSNQSGALSCATISGQIVTAPFSVAWYGRIINWLGNPFSGPYHGTTGVTLFTTRTTGADQSPTLLLQGGSANPNYGAVFTYDTAGIAAGASSSTYLSLDTPYLIVGTVDNASNYSIYVNGELLGVNNFSLAGARGATFSGTTWYTGWAPQWDGTYYNNPSGPATNLLAGWNRILTPSEIQQLYANPYCFFAGSPLPYFSVPNLDIPNETTGGVW